MTCPPSVVAPRAEEVVGDGLLKRGDERGIRLIAVPVEWS
jgi:hypothetical protein